jgi:integrase
VQFVASNPHRHRRPGQPSSWVAAGAGVPCRRLVSTWSRRAGIKGTVRPHGLRHSSASTVTKRGSLSQLLALGQWSSLSAVKRYIDQHDSERASALRLVDL